jgi:hypothetical protein
MKPVKPDEQVILAKGNTEVNILIQSCISKPTINL